MGRRSINTTKSGKYMNPTDQARKEARKKELKKNKRQRQMVRAAVLKNKDPSQILEEMEKIDEMEYNVLQPSPLNEKVLRDKRKKLKETFDRVMRLYHNDEPEHWVELKRKEVDYEKKRLKKQQYYESVKHAQSVQIDEIPLPAPVTAANASSTGGNTANSANNSNSTSSNSNIVFPSSGIRMPPPPITLALLPFAPGAPPGVTKNSEGSGGNGDVQTEKAKDDDDKDWLGVPPGPPPDLFAMSELNSDAEGNSDYEGDESTVTSPKLQQRMQNIDDFMKEMEHVHKRKHRKLQSDTEHDKEQQSDDPDDRHDSASDSKSPPSRRRASSHSSSSITSDDEDNDDDDDADDDMGSDGDEKPSPIITTKETTAKAMPVPPGTTSVPAPPTAPTMPAIPLPPSAPAPPQLPQLPHMRGIAPPPSVMFRPPPMRPPGPGLPGFGLRMPPGPPPGSRPPHVLGPMPRMGIRMPPGPPPGLPPRMGGHHVKHGNVSAPPLKEPGKGVTTITAKPQIRNLSADVTRFVPSTLRVKREDQRRTARTKHLAGAHDAHGGDRGVHAPPEAHKPPTKDDAYLQFMNEMQGLL
ncbi:WW domain-binding protein 11 [Drosophila grimshawi]|uniref:GH11943 n=1 Tax=Drosophila grimshawi TaxID=7222 RepID=B4JL30_DROGR|nr:WW domain-binding protein 11 [Drosophila grimshawi]EDW00283.1 GH11943 [Drosophila grimshawi]